MQQRSMLVVKRNLAANVAGKAWSAAISLAVVPVYLHILGIEIYGLIGFYVSMTAVLSLLDLGLGTALNRQFAQYSVTPGKEAGMGDLLRTLEVIYWLVGIAVGAAVVAAAPWFALHWFQSSRLHAEDLAEIIILMGIALACQWPRALYSGGLLGMQKQVLQNTVSVFFVTLLNAGGVLVIWKVAPTLHAFLSWQIVVNLSESVVTGAILWKSLPRARRRPHFDAALLRTVWRFAVGMAAISVTAVALTQLDKIILSKILTLEAYGYYMLAWRLTTGLYYIVLPANTAFFPRFSQLVALGDKNELARLYHRSVQFLSVALLPITVMFVLFPEPILTLWTWNPVVAARSSDLLALLVLGTALNGLMNLPLALQLAYGSTRLMFFYNLVAVVAMGPLIYRLTFIYGVAGAAWLWLALNAGYVFVLLPLMHRRVLQGHLREWYVTDVGTPLLAALSTALACKYIFPAPVTGAALVAYMAVCTTVVLLTAAVAAPQTRALLRHWVCVISRRALLNMRG